MDPSDSTTVSSAITTQGPPPASSSSTGPTEPGGAPPAQVLEISLISAQDLTPLYKSMRTYAVTWINPNQKLTTRTDQHHTNPTWNDKFTFNVDIYALKAANSALHVEIYTVSWFRHVLVGSVKVLITDLLPPSSQNNTRFVALQVRRPSGTPQGILNMGVTLHDHSLRAMFRQAHHDNFSEISRRTQDVSLPHRRTDNQEEDSQYTKKIQLWRRSCSESEINNEDFTMKTGSVCNGSMVNGSMLNGSELCSDIGPSASIVAADLARKMQPLPPPVMKPRPVVRHIDCDDSSSVVEDLTMEEAVAKGYRTRNTGDRWQKVVYDYDRSELSSASSMHSRRNSDGGLFSCFVYGMEFRIVCGAGSSPESGSKHGSDVSRRTKELK